MKSIRAVTDLQNSVSDNICIFGILRLLSEIALFRMPIVFLNKSFKCPIFNLLYCMIHACDRGLSPVLRKDYKCYRSFQK